MTLIQRLALAYISDCIGGGLPPTVREIGAYLSMSSATGARVRRQLVALGMLELDAPTQRAVRLTARAEAYLLKNGKTYIEVRR